MQWHIQPRLLGALALAVAVAAPNAAQAQVKTYNIAAMADFSGPFAEAMKPYIAARDASLDWWNTEVGAKIGVRLAQKTYDMRYDAAQVATLWPGVKSELNPIVLIGVGGPEISALKERLPNDKVPLLLATGAFGFAWQPNQWFFTTRPTYSHESVALFDWLHARNGGTRPLRVAMVISEAAPAFVDLWRGIEAWGKATGKIEIVEVVRTEPTPTDLTAQMRIVVGKKVDIIGGASTMGMVVAVKRGLQALNARIPLALSSHNGLVYAARVLGGMEQMEGDYEAYSMALSVPEGPAFDFFNKLKDQYKLQAPWSPLVAQGMTHAVFVGRAIEAATATVGADKLSGDAVYNALLARPIQSNQTFGLTSMLKFERSAPFPQSGVTVNIGVVKDGKYRAEAIGVPVPTIPKW